MLSSPQGTEMFQFPWLSQPALCVQTGVVGHDSNRVSPFGNPRINACLTANRGLSQPAASFIDSWCQGIHQWPLVAWIDTRIQDNICARYAVLKKPRLWLCQSRLPQVSRPGAEGSVNPPREVGSVAAPSQLNNVVCPASRAEWSSARQNSPNECVNQSQSSRRELKRVGNADTHQLRARSQVISLTS